LPKVIREAAASPPLVADPITAAAHSRSTVFVRRRQCVRPSNTVERFLGISNHFRRLIKNYSQRSTPLHELMARHQTFEWTARQDSSFCHIRDALCSPPVLDYPDRNKRIRVILDAASTCMGGRFRTHGPNIYPAEACR